MKSLDFTLKRILSVWIITVASVLSGISYADNDNAIVGTYACNAVLGAGTPFEAPSYVAVTFNTGGTVHFVSTTSNNQPIPNLAPVGNYGSPNLGIWKNIGQNKFKLVTTSVINSKDAIDPNLGTPSTRERFDAIAELSKNGDTFTVTGTDAFFVITDPTLSTPVVFPNGTPIVLPVTGTCYRLKF